MIEVVVSRELGEWAHAWDALVLQLPLATPFLRSWWLEATAEPTRCYLLCLDGEELVGGVALFRWRRVVGVPIYRLAGSGTLCPDHLDLLRAPGREQEVIAALRAWAARRTWVLDARGLVDGALLLDALPWRRVEPLDVAPYEPLPATAEAYLAARSRNYRRSTSAAEKRLAEQGVTYRRPTGAAAAEALDRFADLHRARGDRAELLQEMPRLRRAVLAGVARGEAHIDMLTGADVVAVDISFQVGGVLRMYQSARRMDQDARGAGPVLITRAVEQACADGCTELDLLRGDEDYKRRLTTRRRPLLRAWAANGLRGRAVLAALRAARHSAAALRRSRPVIAAARITATFVRSTTGNRP